jgi:uncharacterized membrane protein HdeD (DUF308 family)
MMDSSYRRFGGISAILVGLLSVAYAVFYLVIARQAPFTGLLGSWLILAASGLFSSAAYVALYSRLRLAGEEFALWALLLGTLAGFATMAHGAYEALLMLAEPAAAGAAQQPPSQVDPAGLATFFVVGIVSLLFGWLILQSDVLPRALGYLGLFNGVLLIVLYFASAAAAQTLILISGGLTSVIAGPIWWIWLGRRLLQMKPSTSPEIGPAPRFAR